MTTAPGLAFLDAAGGCRIAYRLRTGSPPTIVFLPGYGSDMEGAKAVAIDAFAGERGLGCLRIDYSGTGASDGDFADGTLERWLGEALAAIDRLSDGPVILAGSSMGGWIALHVALRRPERVAALLGIAAAPDFTDWGFTADQKRALRSDGRLERASAYVAEPQLTTRAFWESAETLRLLGGPIAVRCPVRLVHGEADTDVPLSIALRLMAALGSADVQLKVLKGGGHRLSGPLEIGAILRDLAELTEPAR